MNPSSAYRLLGGPGSPYSLKMRAALRYRRLPHTWTVPLGYIGSDGELAMANKKMIPVLQLPEDGSYWADSTPMIYALESRHPGQRSLIPSDPADAFLAHLIEDFADELLVLAMFAYRWSGAADLAFCPRRQLAGWLGAMQTDRFEAIVAQFTERQTTLMRAVGPAEVNLPLYETMYLDLLAAIDKLLTQDRYLFGTRPSIAEIGLFGQMSQLAIDPTASNLMKARAPRVFQWVQDLDDASGIDGQWRGAGEAAPDALADLVRLVVRYYAPYALAQARAAADGSTSITLDYGTGLQIVGRANPYTAKCLLWLKDEYARLDDVARGKVDAVLGAADAGAWLRFGDGEATCVAPHLPV